MALYNATAALQQQPVLPAWARPSESSVVMQDKEDVQSLLPPVDYKVNPGGISGLIQTLAGRDKDSPDELAHKVLVALKWLQSWLNCMDDKERAMFEQDSNVSKGLVESSYSMAPFNATKGIIDTGLPGPQMKSIRSDRIQINHAALMFSGGRTVTRAEWAAKLKMFGNNGAAFLTWVSQMSGLALPANRHSQCGSLNVLVPLAEFLLKKIEDTGTLKRTAEVVGTATLVGSLFTTVNGDWDFMGLGTAGLTGALAYKAIANSIDAIKNLRCIYLHK